MPKIKGRRLLISKRLYRRFCHYRGAILNRISGVHDRRSLRMETSSAVLIDELNKKSFNNGSLIPTILAAKRFKLTSDLA